MIIRKISRIHVTCGLLTLIGAAVVLLSPTRASAQTQTCQGPAPNQSSWTYGPTTIGYYVTANYLTALGRQPDTSGWDYWTSSLCTWNGNSNCTRPVQPDPATYTANSESNNAIVASSFTTCPEYQSYYYSCSPPGQNCTPPSNQTFASNVCQNVCNQNLGSNGDCGAWLSLLNQGLAQNKLIADDVVNTYTQPPPYSDFNNEYGSIAGTYCTGQAVPTPAGFPPTTVPTSTPLQITIGYANNTCSTTNFYNGQIAIASVTDTQNGTLSNFAAACYIQWDTSGNVTLYDNGTPHSGAMGQAATLSGSLCSVNLQYSSGSFNSSTGLYNVQLDLTFPSAFTGSHAVWSYATDTYGTSSPWTNLSWNGGKGMLTVSQSAPNFTITAAPNTRTVRRGYSTSYTLTVTPQNGFNGTVYFDQPHVSGLPSGATVTFSPTYIPGGSGSTSFTIQTASGGSTGAYDVAVTGYAGTLEPSVPVSLAVTTLVVSDPHTVSNTDGSAHRFEASTAAGSTTWATIWSEVPQSNPSSLVAYVSTWNGNWSSPTALIPPGGQPTVDAFVTWNPSWGGGRFMFVLLDGSRNVWFGYSNDSLGSSWTIASTAVLPNFDPGTYQFYLWDYPSVAFDSSGTNGRIIIGATNNDTQDNRFYTSVSINNGSTFSAPAPIPTPQTPPTTLGNVRVIGTNGTFHAFLPTLDYGPLRPDTINGIDRWESTDGTSSGSWSYKEHLPLGGSGVGPPNTSASNIGNIGGYPVYYAPFLDASGNANGHWSVVFPVNYQGYSNAYVCTNFRGCGPANQGTTDEFLAAGHLAADDSIWITYKTFDISDPSGTTLRQDALYLPAGGGYYLSTIGSGINPASWYAAPAALGRCPNTTCWAEGDYTHLASNPSAGASALFVSSACGMANSSTDVLCQKFAQAQVGGGGPQEGSSIFGKSPGPPGPILPSQRAPDRSLWREIFDLGKP